MAPVAALASSAISQNRGPQGGERVVEVAGGHALDRYGVESRFSARDDGWRQRLLHEAEPLHEGAAELGVDAFHERAGEVLQLEGDGTGTGEGQGAGDEALGVGALCQSWADDGGPVGHEAGGGG